MTARPGRPRLLLALLGLVLLLGAAPASALAANPPVAFTDYVQPTGATTAYVTANIDADGQATTYQAQYDLASSDWCTSNGNDGSPANATTPHDVSGTGYAYVTVKLTGLSAGADYCVQLSATNASGGVLGGSVTFTAGAPTTDTYTVQSTGPSTASVTGTVNPAGQATTYDVQYGPESSDWCTSWGADGSPRVTTQAHSPDATDTTDHDVSVNLTGLTPGAAYCVQLVAANNSATANGGIQTFTAGAPTATIDSPVHNIGGSTATVTYIINPSGQATTVEAQYDPASSDWCTTDGAQGSPANTTPSQSLGFTGTSDHDATVNLTGLKPGAAYCIQGIATNASGSASGDIQQFTAGAPSVTLNSILWNGPTSAILDASVDPAGQSATYQAQYDPASSDWCTSNGNDGSPANTTSAQPLSSMGDETVTLTGLTAGASYCAQIVITNASASAVSGQQQFTVGRPTATTDTVVPDSTTSATVAGVVAPNEQATTYQVQYDTADSMWCESNGVSGPATYTTSPQSLAAEDSTTHAVTIDLTGLNQGAGYCVQLIATNAAGTTEGGVIYLEHTPQANTDSASATDATTATVLGDIIPEGLSTSYQVQYDLADSTWCESQGAGGTPSYTTATQPLATADYSDHDVSVQLTGLSAGTEYCVQLIATNHDGSNQGATVTFSTPSTMTVTVVGTGQGIVAGQATSCQTSCTFTLPAGRTLTLTATPASGSTFAGWNGACSGTGICQVTNGDAGDSVTATFTAATPTPTPIPTPTPSPNPKPTPTPKPTPKPTPALAPGPTVTVGRPLASGSITSVPVACKGTSSCTVAFSLTVQETLKGSRVIAVAARATAAKTKRRTVTVGAVTMTVKSGRSQTAAVTLNATGRRLLSSRKTLSTQLTATSAGKTVMTKTVTFHASVKKRRP